MGHTNRLAWVLRSGVRTDKRHIISTHLLC